MTINAATAPAVKSSALINMPIASAINIIGKSGMPKSNLLTSTPQAAWAKPSRTYPKPIVAIKSVSSL